jgi:hypothetical protein
MRPLKLSANGPVAEFISLDASNRDDSSAVSYMARCLMRGNKDAPNIHRDHAVEIVLRNFLNRGHHGNSSVVH